MSFYPFFIFTLSFRHTVLSRSSSLPCSRRAGAQMRGRERGRSVDHLMCVCVHGMAPPPTAGFGGRWASYQPAKRTSLPDAALWAFAGVAAPSAEVSTSLRAHSQITTMYTRCQAFRQWPRRRCRQDYT